MGGAPLFGLLERSGVGAAVEGAPPPDVALLWQRRQRSNGELLASLKQDEFSAELMALTAKDARLGRMSWPVPVEEFSEQDLNALLLAPRFGVEQGLKDDGSVKVRAVDNFSWSCVPEECEVRRSKKVVKGVLCTSICAVHGGGAGAIRLPSRLGCTLVSLVQAIVLMGTAWPKRSSPMTIWTISYDR